MFNRYFLNVKDDNENDCTFKVTGKCDIFKRVKAST